MELIKIYLYFIRVVPNYRPKIFFLLMFTSVLLNIFLNVSMILLLFILNPESLESNEFMKSVFQNYNFINVKTLISFTYILTVSAFFFKLIFSASNFFIADYYRVHFGFFNLRRILKNMIFHKGFINKKEIIDKLTVQNQKGQNFTELIIANFSQYVSFIIIIITLLLLDFKISLITLFVLLIFYVLIGRFFFKRINLLSQDWLVFSRNFTNNISFLVNQLSIISKHNSQKHFFKISNALNNNVRYQEQKINYTRFYANLSFELLTLIILLMLSLFFFNQENSAILYAIILLVFRLLFQLQTITNQNNKIVQRYVSFEAITKDLFDKSIDLGNKSDFIINDILKIELKNFSTKDCKSKINFVLNKGGLVFIKNEKINHLNTCLSKLSNDFSGEILFNNININKTNKVLNLKFLSSNELFFDGTLIDNIAFNCDKKHHDEIIKFLFEFNFDKNHDKNSILNFNVDSYGSNLSKIQKNIISLLRIIFSKTDFIIIESIELLNEKSVKKKVLDILSEKNIGIISYK